MKLKDLSTPNTKQVNEVAYTGNLGMMEMFKFYQVATEDQKRQMKELIEKHLNEKAWEFLQFVTGVKLK
jgi:hypothetical protein